MTCSCCNEILKIIPIYRDDLCEKCQKYPSVKPQNTKNENGPKKLTKIGTRLKTFTMTILSQDMGGFKKFGLHIRELENNLDKVVLEFKEDYTQIHVFFDGHFFGILNGFRNDQIVTISPDVSVNGVALVGEGNAWINLKEFYINTYLFGLLKQQNKKRFTFGDLKTIEKKYNREHNILNEDHNNGKLLLENYDLTCVTCGEILKVEANRYGKCSKCNKEKRKSLEKTTNNMKKNNEIIFDGPKKIVLPYVVSKDMLGFKRYGWHFQELEKDTNTIEFEFTDDRKTEINIYNRDKYFFSFSIGDNKPLSISTDTEWKGVCLIGENAWINLKETHVNTYLRKLLKQQNKTWFTFGDLTKISEKYDKEINEDKS